MKSQKTQESQSKLNRTIPDFKIYSRSRAVKADSMALDENKHVGQQNNCVWA